jgi:Zn-dependent M28 family amino/carboxypeptidase
VTQPLPSIARAQRTTLAVSPARLEAHVRALSQEFVPRDYTHPENLDRAAGYIRTQLTRAGGATSDQPYNARGRTYRNVIAAFGPDTRARIVVGAHYDADGPLPGADDNASGVAGLIELAYLLGRSPPRTRVELVAYSLEELPFFGTADMGSAVHVHSLQQQRAEVRAMFSLEMIGYFSDEPASQEFPLDALRPFYPSRGNFIAVVGKPGQTSLVRKIKRAMRNASPLPVHSINAPRWVPGVDFSDHVSYWDAGYPAVMITDTAWYRNPNYHTARDTAETLDYARMAMVVQGVDAAVRAIAR